MTQDMFLEWRAQTQQYFHTACPGLGPESLKGGYEKSSRLGHWLHKRGETGIGQGESEMQREGQKLSPLSLTIWDISDKEALEFNQASLLLCAGNLENKSEDKPLQWKHWNYWDEQVRAILANPCHSCALHGDRRSPLGTPVFISISYKASPWMCTRGKAHRSVGLEQGQLTRHQEWLCAVGARNSSCTLLEPHPWRAGGHAARGFLSSGKARAWAGDANGATQSLCPHRGFSLQEQTPPAQPSFPCCHMEGVFAVVPKLPSCNRALDLNFYPLSSLALHQPGSSWDCRAHWRTAFVFPFPAACSSTPLPFTYSIFPSGALGCCCQWSQITPGATSPLCLPLPNPFPLLQFSTCPNSSAHDKPLLCFLSVWKPQKTKFPFQGGTGDFPLNLYCCRVMSSRPKECWSIIKFCIITLFWNTWK